MQHVILWCSAVIDAHLIAFSSDQDAAKVTLKLLPNEKEGLLFCSLAAACKALFCSLLVPPAVAINLTTI